MAKRKELTNSVKNLINEQWKAGKSYRKISETFCIPFSTIPTFIQRNKKSGTVENRIRSGAPRKISPRSLRKMK
uniref:Sleeping Beauty transposase HTH domain-containing protein n=1 Tax=Octopus bimaculoides TaxID=37653 RepID=A0A0L8GIR1_OCTBM